MRVFISYEKLSKKEKRKIDLKSRGDWGGVKPIDTKHKKLKLLSFMRDTWVVVPGHGENKLNSAGTYGGAE